MPFIEYTEPLRGSLNGIAELRIRCTKGRREVVATSEMQKTLGLGADKLQYRVFVDKENSVIGICADPKGMYRFAPRSGSLRAVKQCFCDLGIEWPEKGHALKPILPKEGAGLQVVAFAYKALVPK